MMPTSDYHDVGDEAALWSVSGSDVLVRPRGRAWGYEQARVWYSWAARQWALAYVGHDKRVRRVAMYRNASELIKDVQVMARQ